MTRIASALSVNSTSSSFSSIALNNQAYSSSLRDQKRNITTSNSGSNNSTTPTITTAAIAKTDKNETTHQYYNNSRRLTHFKSYFSTLQCSASATNETGNDKVANLASLDSERVSNGNI